MSQSIGIVGAGITGLAIAYVLSPKYNVTIVARDLPGDLGLDWASPWAGAVFHPQKTPNKLWQQMQAACFRFYWALAHDDPSSGVKVYPMTEYFDTVYDESDIWYKSLMPDYRVIPTSELPPRTTFGIKYTTLAMNPLTLLPWLKAKLLAKGVKFIRKEVVSFDEVRTLTNAKLIVNASGVGARKLAGDDSVGPVRGQTMFVKTDFNRLVMKEGTEYTYIIPRAGSGGVIMGGIKSDRLDSEVDVELKRDILMRVNRITNGAFEGLDTSKIEDIVGFRPGRKGGLRVGREGDVVHAYGVEGAGYIYSFGVAEKVKELVGDYAARSKL
ncbi:D-amino-acid oxidase [Lachnellula suecica]|uniref:D-amino-acid oxidase n=1 Tax=Lachnellula suecica TaxID=602035 RepID=A0A8T9C5D0_9HELO|nr:D-amino-acid oxidase [Lachnellula suecica]